MFVPSDYGNFVRTDFQKYLPEITLYNINLGMIKTSSPHHNGGIASFIKNKENGTGQTCAPKGKNLSNQYSE